MTSNNHKLVYCRDCRTQNSFELCPSRDITTESGRVFMLGFKCKECGRVVIVTNPDYETPAVLSEVKQ